MGILAVDDEHVWLTRQPREAAGLTASLEIPAGKRDVDGEPPLETAKRELAEEIGKRAASWQELKVFYTSPGFSDERVWLYLARELSDDADAEPDEDERIEIVPWPLDDLDAAIAECEDSKSLIALLWLALARAARHRLTGARTTRASRRTGGGREYGSRWRPPTLPGAAAADRSDARVPGHAGARARAVSQHAGGLPVRSAAVRGVPGPPGPGPAGGGADRSGGVRLRARRPGATASRPWPRPRCSARSPACARSTATCAASRSSITIRPPSCARRARADACPRS